MRKTIAAMFALAVALLPAVGLTACGDDDDNNTATGSGEAQGNVINGHEYVDLGLPSGTLWATCNVGADKATAYGSYFAWGETSTKETYAWSSYKWCNGSAEALTKYCTDSADGDNGFTDNKTTLDAADDVAAVAWGGTWRMPAPADFQELKDYCDWEWVYSYGGEEVKGCTVTSKANGAVIFLPASGYIHGTAQFSAGGHGYYWASSLKDGDDTTGRALYFGNGSVNTDKYADDRCRAFSVRPVSDKK